MSRLVRAQETNRNRNSFDQAGHCSVEYARSHAREALKS